MEVTDNRDTLVLLLINRGGIVAPVGCIIQNVVQRIINLMFDSRLPQILSNAIRAVTSNYQLSRSRSRVARITEESVVLQMPKRSVKFCVIYGAATKSPSEFGRELLKAMLPPLFSTA